MAIQSNFLDVFMRRYYSVFDYQNQRLGLAPAKSSQEGDANGGGGGGGQQPQPHMGHPPTTPPAEPAPGSTPQQQQQPQAQAAAAGGGQGAPAAADGNITPSGTPAEAGVPPPVVVNDGAAHDAMDNQNKG